MVESKTLLELWKDMPKPIINIGKITNDYNLKRIASNEVNK